jgi:hypothetical protein
VIAQLGGTDDTSIIVTVIVSMLNFGRVVTYTVFAYTFCANAFFLVCLRVEPSDDNSSTQLRSLKYVLLPDPTGAGVSAVTISHAQRSRRVQFLFIVAVVQLFWMGALVSV